MWWVLAIFWEFHAQQISCNLGLVLGFQLSGQFSVYTDASLATHCSHLMNIILCNNPYVSRVQHFVVFSEFIHWMEDGRQGQSKIQVKVDIPKLRTLRIRKIKARWFQEFTASFCFKLVLRS